MFSQLIRAHLKARALRALPLNSNVREELYRAGHRVARVLGKRDRFVGLPLAVRRGKELLISVDVAGVGDLVENVTERVSLNVCKLDSRTCAAGRALCVAVLLSYVHAGVHRRRLGGC